MRDEAANSDCSKCTDVNGLRAERSFANPAREHICSKLRFDNGGERGC
jgi:hypothetical protein